MESGAGATDKVVIKIPSWGGRPIVAPEAAVFLKRTISSFTISAIILNCEGDHAMRLAFHYLFAVLVLTVYGGQV